MLLLKINQWSRVLCGVGTHEAITLSEAFVLAPYKQGHCSILFLVSILSLHLKI